MDKEVTDISGQAEASSGAETTIDVGETVEVQDAAREELMRQRFGLSRSGQGRGGTDAIDDDGNPFELKSGTSNQITTGRDLAPHTLERYRTRYWLICKGTNRPTGFDMQECLFATPQMLDWRFSELSKKLSPSLDLVEKVLAILRASPLSADLVERAESLLRRGMTINNPKINFNKAKANAVSFDMTKDLPSQLKELVAQHPLQAATGVEAASADKDSSSHAL